MLCHAVYDRASLRRTVCLADALASLVEAQGWLKDGIVLS
jgi:hypothetical protein